MLRIRHSTNFSRRWRFFTASSTCTSSAITALPSQLTRTTQRTAPTFPILSSTSISLAHRRLAVKEMSPIVTPIIVQKYSFCSKSRSHQSDNNNNNNNNNNNSSSTGNYQDHSDAIMATTMHLRMNGEECYQCSLEYFDRHVELQRQTEEENAKEQYDSMMNVHQHYNDPPTTTRNNTPSNTKTNTKMQNRQANVAVVQTIVKQTKSKKKDDIKSNNNHNDNAAKSQQDSKLNFLEEAKKYMQIAAFVHGHPKALVQLANEALELAKSKSESDETIIKSTYEYITPSMNSIIISLEGIDDYTDLGKALYQEAIDRGNNTAAMFNLAHLLWTEAEFDFQSNNKSCEEKKLEALALFQRAAVEFDDPDALYFLGFQYMSLLNVEEDVDGIDLCTSLPSIIAKLLDYNKIQQTSQLRILGHDMILKASNLGHGGASYYLSLLHRNGDMDLQIEPSLSKFRQFLDQACDNGNNSDALYLRGHCQYHKEDGYGESDGTSSATVTRAHCLKGALDDFIRSGELGNPDGYISAGALIFHGHGTIIPQDQRKAFELYQEAAEMGSKEGWRNVVACYALGTGVPKCEQTAKYISETMLKDDT